MYAVIATGGKQERVSEGQTLNVELLGVDEGSTVTFDTLLVVDGTKVLATPEQLKGASVTGRVIGEARGPKINGFTYKSKSNNRKRWGHRQHYTTVEITSISAG